MDENTVVVLLEVWIGAIAVVLLIVTLWMLVKWCSSRLRPGYMAVNHSLDDEERRFQRSLEASSQDEIDDLFRFDEDEGDVEFDQSELQQVRHAHCPLPMPLLALLAAPSRPPARPAQETSVFTPACPFRSRVRPLWPAPNAGNLPRGFDECGRWPGARHHRGWREALCNGGSFAGCGGAAGQGGAVRGPKSSGH